MTVRRLAMAWCVAGALAFAVPAIGAAQAKEKPKDATGQCKDGTYSSAKNKSGACSGHGGVATWYAEDKGSTKTTDKESKTASKTSAKESKTKTTDKSADKGDKTAAKTATKETKSSTKTADKESKTAAKESKTAAKETTPTETRPAGAPADATAQCNDGTYSKAVHHQGACSGHKGVKTWYK